MDLSKDKETAIHVRAVSTEKLQHNGEGEVSRAQDSKNMRLHPEKMLFFPLLEDSDPPSIRLTGSNPKKTLRICAGERRQKPLHVLVVRPSVVVRLHHSRRRSCGSRVGIFLTCYRRQTSSTRLVEPVVPTESRVQTMAWQLEILVASEIDVWAG